MATKDPRKAQIERDFSRHEVDKAQAALLEGVDADTRRLALKWYKYLPDGVNRSQALAFLKQARFHANAAIAGDTGVDTSQDGVGRKPAASSVVKQAPAAKAAPAKKAAAPAAKKVAPAKKAAPAKKTVVAEESTPTTEATADVVPFGRRKRG
jgi:hypothetical protein